MKILGLAHAYVGHGRNAGAETTLHDILADWASRGAQVDIVLDRKTDFKKNTVIDGVTVHPLEPAYNTFYDNAKDADILISHLDCSEVAGYVHEATGTPFVQLVHNTLWQTEGYLSQGCQLAIYNSQWVSDYHTHSPKSGLAMLASQQGEELVNINLTMRKASEWPGVVCHPPINYDAMKVVPSGEYITLINLFERKGAKVFYALAEALPHRQFLGVHGGYGKQMLRNLPNVTLWENKEDVRAIYQQTKVLLMPSIYETFGRVALEAAISGIPTIATPTEGLVEALGNSSLYCSVTPSEPDPWGETHPEPTARDVERWAEAIETILDNYDRYSQDARARAQYWKGLRTLELDRLWKALIEVDRKHKFG